MIKKGARRKDCCFLKWKSENNFDGGTFVKYAPALKAGISADSYLDESCDATHSRDSQ